MAFQQNYEVKEFMMPLDDRGYEIVKDAEGENTKLTRALANQMFVQTLDKKTGLPRVSILKVGLQWKMDQLYGQNNYEEDIENLAFINLEHYNIARKQAGIPSGEMFIMYRCELWLPGRTRPIREYGEVNKGNLKGNKHPHALAITRARNRAFRVATRCGFASADENYDEGIISNSPGQFIEAQKKKALQILQIKLKEGEITRPEAIDFYNSIFPDREKKITSSTQLNLHELQVLCEQLDIKKQKEENKAIVDNAIKKWDGQPQKPAVIQIKEPEEQIENQEDPPEEVSKTDQNDDLIDEYMAIDAEFREETDDQIVAIQELYKLLKWDQRKISSFFEGYSQNKKKDYKSENDLNKTQKEGFINYLNDLLQKASV